jgi:HPt (histidine-containing phosphotransfer) domain-containing protein/HAMP domain-containing protein
VTALQPKKIFLSIGTRLTVLVVALVALVAFGVYVGIVRTSRAEAMRSKELAVDMVVGLASASVSPAVVFGDLAEIGRSVNDLARNPEVTDVEVWDVEQPAQAPHEELEPLASFHRAGGQPLGRPASTRSERRLEHDSLCATEPVLSLEHKPIAMLAVRFSTSRETIALSSLAHQILYVAMATALCLAGAILLAFRGLVVSPLRRLGGDARRLARGDDVANVDRARASGKIEDEVGQLATAFGDMAKAVRDRELRLAVRNGELRIILDSVDQGFLSATPEGALMPERSAVVEKWVGELPPGAFVWDLVRRLDPASSDWAEAAWSQLLADFLPMDVALAQLPKRLVRQGQHFELVYHPVMHDDALERIIIVLTNVTAEVERQKVLTEQHEFSTLVDQFVRDRRAFFDFWNEASALVANIVGDSRTRTPEALRRDLHTLKGNTRFFGLARVSALCHSLEDTLAERGEDVLTADERAGLGQLWEALHNRMEPLLHGATGFVEVSKDEYDRLVDAVAKRVSFETLEGLVQGLRREPTVWRLQRAREAILATCKKLNKPAPAIVLHDHGLSLPPGRLAPFWSVFLHVLNNAVDHGLESEEERQRSNKPVPATIAISTRIIDAELVIELSDDGRGIDWSRVRAVAEAKGLPSRSQSDLNLALLSEGFSLRAQVSEVSGRGMGLAAVRNVVKALGGSVEIESTVGMGTTWRFKFGARELGADPGRNVVKVHEFSVSEQV